MGYGETNHRILSLHSFKAYTLLHYLLLGLTASVCLFQVISMLWNQQLGSLELFLQSEKEQWSREGSCSLDAAQEPLEIRKCLPADSQMRLRCAFQCSVSHGLHFFQPVSKFTESRECLGMSHQCSRTSFCTITVWEKGTECLKLGLMCSF